MQALIENRFQECILAAPDSILVGTDLSDTEYLLPHVVAQAKTSGAHVTLLHVVHPPASEYEPIYSAKMMRDIRVSLVEFAHKLKAEGIPSETVILRGDPSTVIQEELIRSGAKRLIISSHGRSTLGRMMLGSVAQELVSRAKVPVFVVGPHARNWQYHAVPRRILHPVSLMGDYRATVDLAQNIAQSFRAELTLLHVLDRDVAQQINPSRTMTWIKRELELLAPDGTNLVPPVYTAVAIGKLHEEILKTAESTNADLIVLGANSGHRTWSFNETASYKVMAAAGCPVLTLCHNSQPAWPVTAENVHFTSPS